MPIESASTAPRTPPSDDAEAERRLVEGLLARRDEAIAEFLSRTHHPVYCMAARLAADSGTRRDWSHDVLLGILEDLERGRFDYRGPGTFWAWFKKRAYFRLLDRYRRSKLDGERETPQGGTFDLPELHAAGLEDPVEEMGRVETRAAIEACLARLENADHRRALDLLLFQDLAYESIAIAMDAPLNTVRAWIRRGRLLLRKCLVHTLGWDAPETPS